MTWQKNKQEDSKQFNWQMVQRVEGQFAGSELGSESPPLVDVTLPETNSNSPLNINGWSMSCRLGYFEGANCLF